MASQYLGQLVQLKKGMASAAKVDVYHQQQQGQTPKLILKGVSKPLISHMSAASSAVLDDSAPGVITIRASMPLLGVRGVVHWIRACGNAGKVVKFWSPAHKGFCQQAQVWLVADFLHVKELPMMLEGIMRERGTKQIHSEVVAEVYDQISSPNLVTEIVSKSIATAIFEERCAHIDKYFKLCRQAKYQGFIVDLESQLDKIEAAWLKTPKGKAWRKSYGNEREYESVYQWKARLYL